MTEPASALSAWESFYVIVGSSGGALIGLQFVVITLVGDRRRRTNEDELHAFGTPTVVHFAGALAVSAVMSVPWHSMHPASIAMGLGGVAGLGYSALVSNRARRQTSYKPLLEDWVWYVVFPAVIYGWLTVAALMLPTNERLGLIGIASSALAFLLLGIRNAWDTVTHLVVSEPPRKK